jgi:hypothetical protein
MKKLFLIRFGTPMPTPGDQMAIDRVGCRETSVGAGSPFGILSIFGTDKSPAEVMQIFKEVAAEIGDHLPIIVWEEGNQVAFDLDPQFFEHFEPMNEEWEKSYGAQPKRCTMSLDELLDLVSKKGLANLSTEELTRLKELSR